VWKNLGWGAASPSGRIWFFYNAGVALSSNKNISHAFAQKAPLIISLHA
jgi:hypothetical protein